MDTPAIEPALARLRAISDENPGLRKAVHFYQQMIPVLKEMSRTISVMVIDPDIPRNKMIVGIPLLVGEPYEFDNDKVHHIFKTVCTIAANGMTARKIDFPGAAGVRSPADRILQAVEKGDLDPISLISVDQNGQADLVELTASRLGLDPPLLGLVTQNTLKVFLYAWRAALETQANLDEWRRSACPFCGGEAGLAEIRGVESARYLHCLHCGAGWPYPNLCCAFCGNEDHRSLGVVLIDGSTSKPYLHTCDHCHRYIKTVVNFEPLSPDFVVAENLATLSLDRLAEELGYKA